VGERTGIEWTDHTFNPWIGCTKVSAGCTNCYAARENEHWKWNGGAWGPGALRKVTGAANWREPVKWAREAHKLGVREKVFCASLADVFDAEAPRLARQDLWKLIEKTSYALDWQFLTKRPERIAEVMKEDGLAETFFLDNRCWLGASTEDQPAARLRIPPLVKVLAWVHFLSCEPLLGALDLFEFRSRCTCKKPFEDIADDCPGELQLIDAISWVVCGGESGPNARPLHLDWIRGLREQCDEGGVTFFFKQWGEWAPTDFECLGRTIDGDGAMARVGKKAAGALLDGKEYKQFPVVQP
jgi:protein gp37